MKVNHSILKPFWNHLFKSAWILGLCLIFIWGIPRFLIVLYANKSGNYQWVSLIFISMWFTPWIFLNKIGRYKMGLKPPVQSRWLLYALVIGILCCSLMFLIADFLFQDSINNWFVYISNSYSNLPETISHPDKLVIFWIYAIIGMIFSPIGEEFFYRGIIHECFAAKWNDNIASYVDSASFSLTHLAHFGIVYHLNQWNYLFVPSILWMVLLFFTCILFYTVRKKSGSILGSIFAHASFNFTMMYFIFFHVI